LSEYFVASPHLNANDKKQIVALRQSYQVLFDRLQANELSPEIIQKLKTLVDFLVQRNFAGATSIQTVNTFYLYLFLIYFSDNYIFSL
jgi:hypothetical protein